LLRPGQTEATLRPPAEVGGVCQVTLFEEVRVVGPVPGVAGLLLGGQAAVDVARPGLRPAAQRFVYRRPPGSVDVSVQADNAAYGPGEPARLRLTTRDESGRPAPS